MGKIDQYYEIVKQRSKYFFIFISNHNQELSFTISCDLDPLSSQLKYEWDLFYPES